MESPDVGEDCGTEDEGPTTADGGERREGRGGDSGETFKEEVIG